MENGRMKYPPHHPSTSPIHQQHHNISPTSSHYHPSFHPSSPLHASPVSRDQCHPHHLSREQYLMRRNHHPHRSNKISSDNLFINDNSISVKISEIIDMLNDCSYQTVSNAAAYIQHLSYGDDVMKSLLRKKGVIPTLIGLLRHNVLEIQRNACGALRNMIYGKRNNEAKILVANYGGITSLCHVLESTNDIELKELVTGVLWNLSSCGQLKFLVADTSLRVLANKIVIKYVCIIEPIKMAHYITAHHHHDCDVTHNHADLNTSDVTIQPYWSTLFINATGCLRNMSSGGSEVRRKLRNFDGLIEALLLVVENVIGKNDIDCRGVENCMCILRNLSYHLSTEVELANQPITGEQSQTSYNQQTDNHNSASADCWKLYRKKDKKKVNEHETLSVLMNSTNIHGVELLWHPSVVRRYLALLAETCNNGTLEAAAGALQNLSAGNWRWSANIRTAVRKVKGLPMLVEFLNMENDRIVTVICSTLRNMSIDARNKQLIGKHAMVDFVRLLPEVDLQSIHASGESRPPEVTAAAVTSSLEKLEAAGVAIKELVTGSYENAQQLYTLGGVPALISVNRNQSNSYPPRIVKIVGKILTTLWEYKQIRTLLKQDGWNKHYFVQPTSSTTSPSASGGNNSDVTFSDSSQITPFGSSPPNSPYHQHSFEGGNHDNNGVGGGSNGYVMTSSNQYSPTRYKQQQPLLRHHPTRHTIMTSSPNPHHHHVLDSWV